MNKRSKLVLSVIVIALVTGGTGITVILLSAEKTTPIDPNNISFLALGDSYTIGESVPSSDSWPFQLRDQAMNHDLNITKMDIIAKTGWTSHDLLQNISNTQFNTTYDIVALMIGVNDQFQGVTPDVYESNFTELLTIASSLTYGYHNVIIISIPDYSLSPAICGCAKVIIQQDIDALNQVNRQASTHTGTTYVDITRITRYEGLEPTMYAPDEIHFSGKMYDLWAQEILEKLEGIVS